MHTSPVYIDKSFLTEIALLMVVTTSAINIKTITCHWFVGKVIIYIDFRKLWAKSRKNRHCLHFAKLSDVRISSHVNLYAVKFVTSEHGCLVRLCLLQVKHVRDDKERKKLRCSRRFVYFTIQIRQSWGGKYDLNKRSFSRIVSRENIAQIDIVHMFTLLISLWRFCFATFERLERKSGSKLSFA